VISDKDACYRWLHTELVKFRYRNVSTCFVQSFQS
jgi:hypothetical protein